MKVGASSLKLASIDVEKGGGIDPLIDVPMTTPAITGATTVEADPTTNGTFVEDGRTRFKDLHYVME